MTNPIQLEITETQSPVPPVVARSQINKTQVQALISLIASTDPNLIILPDGKEFSDIRGFNVVVFPNGEGIVNVRF